MSNLKCLAVCTPLFSVSFVQSLNARTESRESWTRAQNGRLAWVGGGGGKIEENVFVLVASLVNLIPQHRVLHARFAHFSFACDLRK